jgi:hypothetical protein
MFRLNLGGGVVAFETEGDADRVGSVSPAELTELHWPEEVIKNVRRYQERQMHSVVEVESSPFATCGTETSDPSQSG